MPGIIGYRVWHVDVQEDVNIPSLRSWNQNYRWQLGINLSACCYGEDKHPDGDLCSICGFWAYSSPTYCLQQGHNDANLALGIIKASGKLVVGQYGFRAEKAEIIALAYGWRTDLESVAAYYDVPLVPITKLDWIFEKHNAIRMEDIPKTWRVKKILPKEDYAWPKIAPGHYFIPQSYTSGVQQFPGIMTTTSSTSFSSQFSYQFVCQKCFRLIWYGSSYAPATLPTLCAGCEASTTN